MTKCETDERLADLVRAMDEDYRRMTGQLFDLPLETQNPIDRGAVSHIAPEAYEYYGDIPDEVIAEEKRKEREREARDAANGVVWESLDEIQFEDVPMRDRDRKPVQAAELEQLRFPDGIIPDELFGMMEMLPAHDGEFAEVRKNKTAALVSEHMDRMAEVDAEYYAATGDERGLNWEIEGFNPHEVCTEVKFTGSPYRDGMKRVMLADALIEVFDGICAEERKDTTGSLSDKDYEHLLEVLDAPPVLTERMQRAARLYRSRVLSQD